MKTGFEMGAVAVGKHETEEPAGIMPLQFIAMLIGIAGTVIVFEKFPKAKFSKLAATDKLHVPCAARGGLPVIVPDTASIAAHKQVLLASKLQAIE